ncbi:MAG: TolC family protein [bacterium]
MSNYLKIIFFYVLIISLPIFGQQFTPLEEYIQEGLKNNIVLQQKKISYDKAIYDLKNANSLFFPSVSLQTGYTSGKGGRSISIPVGDMLNPVYQTLNQLTNSNSFPQINNVSEDFLPYKFYDAKIRTSMPLLNTEIIYNKQIQSGRLHLKEYEVNLYKKELIKEIKTAYYNYLSSIEAINIYSSAIELATEGKRVNESLLKNGSGLTVYLLRSESEIENLKSQLVEIQTNSDNAKKYFNFLLNKELDSPINCFLPNETDNQTITDDEQIDLREEIKMLNQGIEINRSLLNMNKYFWIPIISGFVDVGAQDSNWKYNKNSRYYLFGIQLEVPLFEGFRNLNKIESASLELKNAELELQKNESAIMLSISIAKNAVYAAKKNLVSSKKQLEAASSYNNLIEKGYQQGVNSFIETLDARNQLVTAKMLVNINKHKVLIALANYERESPSTKINY